MSTPSPAVLGLQYIAGSPPEIHGGFREETIAIAKAALAELAQAEKALAELRAIAEGLASFIEEDEDRIYDEVNKQAHKLTAAFTEWKARNP